MRKETFYLTLNNIDDRYITEAKKKSRRVIPLGVIKADFAMAACLCVVLASVFAFTYQRSNPPHPEQLQTPNPLMEVTSVSEMERYLDFRVPVLDKDVEAYIVIVDDSYPTLGRIMYADGSIFNVEYGTGDISGIYGGELVKTETVGEIEVSFFTYTGVEGTETAYATWEHDGFTYSLSGENTSLEQLRSDIQALMK